MPTYDYVCTACGQDVEVVHSVHGHGPTACAKCGGAMKKSFAPPTVHYKGSGWARKEKGSSRSPSRPSAGSAETSAPTDAASSSPAPKPSTEAN